MIKTLRPLLLALCAAAMTAYAADPAPKATTATNPLGGKSAAAKPAPGQPRLIAWEELVPKDWDPMKEFKGMDLSKLEDGDPRVEIKLPGFIVPLEENKGEVTEFLLVPYFGACIHTPPPPANQIVHVRPRQGAKFRAMDTVWITGKLQTLRNDSMMGVSGYHMTAESVTKYTGGAK
jgi:hypothetical protein